jgi:hypothetical protein
MKERQHISYSFDDIRRYRQGQMSRDEMHAFEKASVEDPFLADALEGYMESDMSLAEEHLTEIRERVNAKEAGKEKAIVVPMPAKRFAMWRVAAMVIVIAGAGLLVYKTMDSGDGGTTPPIARVEEKAQPEQPSASTAGTDSNKTSQASPGTGGYAQPTQGTTTSQGLATTDDGQKKFKVQPAEVSTAKAENAEEIMLADRNDNITAAKTRAAEEKDWASKKAPAPANTNYNFSNSYRNNEIRGRVIAPDNTPLVNANIRVENSNREILTDKAGNFTLDQSDSVVNAVVTSEGYARSQVQLRSNTTNTVHLDVQLKKDPSFDEVVVTGVNTARKAKETDTTSTKPEGGWQSFQEYVAQRLNKTVDTTGNNGRIISGHVEMEFFVDGSGRPRNFKVLNSTEPMLNQEAIEAVRQGPKWTKRKKKTRIIIRF